MIATRLWRSATEPPIRPSTKSFLPYFAPSETERINKTSHHTCKSGFRKTAFYLRITSKTRLGEKEGQVFRNMGSTCSLPDIYRAVLQALTRVRNRIYVSRVPLCIDVLARAGLTRVFEDLEPPKRLQGWDDLTLDKLTAADWHCRGLTRRPLHGLSTPTTSKP